MPKDLRLYTELRNVVAIRYLPTNDANDSILSSLGYDALSLAVLYAEKHSLEVTKASIAAIELLRHALKARRYRIIRDSSRSELTLYHLAAARSLANYIGELLKERKFHQLVVDCSNTDGITPMYLAQLFEKKEAIATISYNPWDHVINIIKSHGGKMRYPGKDAEYNVIHTRMYGLIPIDFLLDFSLMCKKKSVFFFYSVPRIVSLQVSLSLVNTPFPSCLVPLFQSESKCKTILEKMTLIYVKMKLRAKLSFI